MLNSSPDKFAADRQPVRRTSSSASEFESVAKPTARLAGMSAVERERQVLKMIRTNAAVEQEYQGSMEWAAERQYFEKQLRDVEPALFTRGASMRNCRRLRHTLRISPEQAQRIRDTGRSVFAFSAAAISEYLRRVHRGGDIVIGVSMLSRSSEGELGTVRHVVNTVPLRVPLDGTLTMTGLADRISSQMGDLQAYQRFAHGDVVAALQERAGMPLTLFDVTYSYLEIPETEHAHHLGEGVNVVASGYSLDAVSILVCDNQRDGSLDVELLYAEDAFDESYRFIDALQHVVILLELALRLPDVPVGKINMLSMRDLEQLHSFCSGGAVDLPRGLTLDRLTAGAPGDQTAVLSSSSTLTYAQFNAAVNNIANCLRGSGVRADDCVAVIVPRGIELVVAIHGVLRAGAAYVPIDPDSPRLRVRNLLRKCRARVIVAGDQYRELAEELAIRRLEPSSTPGNPVETITSPQDLAYVIYTSGSRGCSKGVMVEHRSVINHLHWLQRRYPLGADDVVLQKTPATLGVSVWELMWWAMAGASVALLDPGAERDPRKLIAAIQRHRVTVVHFVPSMLGPFLDKLGTQPGSLNRVASLRRVFCSGEALTPALVEKFNRVFGSADEKPRLVNLYAPIEAAGDVSYFDCPVDGSVNDVPIGKPIDNITLLVLDERGNCCPVGVPGELNIAGIGIARGYRGRDADTAASFVNDAQVAGRRRYRTGDLARWRADGNLEYLGRIDDQMQARRNRATVGEIL